MGATICTVCGTAHAMVYCPTCHQALLRRNAFVDAAIASAETVINTGMNAETIKQALSPAAFAAYQVLLACETIDKRRRLQKRIRVTVEQVSPDWKEFLSSSKTKG